MSVRRVSGGNRRRLVWGSLALALVALCGPAESTGDAQERPRLVVYLRTSIRARAIQSALEGELPAVDVLVVSRHRDFTREVGTHPDAALALQPVLRDQSWTNELTGLRGGTDSEPYVLLSIGASVDLKQPGQLVLGAVDLLGRERTGAFVASLLGSTAPLSIKDVIKTEDLLPLLQFQSVNAVVLSEQEANQIKRISKLDLRVTPLASRVGLPAVAFPTPRGRNQVKPAILKLSADTLSKLGVEAWR